MKINLSKSSHQNIHTRTSHATVYIPHLLSYLESKQPGAHTHILSVNQLKVLCDTIQSTKITVQSLKPRRAIQCLYTHHAKKNIKILKRQTLNMFTGVSYKSLKTSDSIVENLTKELSELRKTENQKLCYNVSSVQFEHCEAVG